MIKKESFKNMSDAERMATIWKEARKVDKGKWKKDMYKNRWGNLVWSSVFVAVTVGFMLYGWFFKETFFSQTRWYILMGLSAIFFMIGLVTWFWYLGIIIKGK